jgi:hypothetical protein
MPTDSTFIPSSAALATTELDEALLSPLHRLSRADFVRAWCSVAYLFPGLHPDGHHEPDSGWPPILRPLADEAWRRFASDELSDEELYPSDAQWCGLYDRIEAPTPEEAERNAELRKGGRR